MANDRNLWVPRTCPPGSRGHPVLVDENAHVYQRQPRRCAIGGRHFLL
jgi:hypothetical protein